MGIITPEEYKSITGGYTRKLNRWLDRMKDWVIDAGFTGLKNKYTRLDYDLNDHIIDIEKALSEMKINMLNNDMIGASCNEQDIAVNCFIISVLISDRTPQSKDNDRWRWRLKVAHNGKEYDKIISKSRRP